MPSQTFYWIGGVSASPNSLSWTELSNWKTLVIPNTAGNTLARLVAATRFPMGGDQIFFGHSTEPAGKYEPVKPTLAAPLLFGGCSAGATAQWHGTTTGSTWNEKYGTISIDIRPTYPFSQIGGDLNTTILNEWANAARSLNIPVSGSFILNSGSVGDPSATFSITGFNENVGAFIIGRTGDGATTGVVDTIGDSFLNEKYIRVKGTVNDYSQSPTTVFLRGVTGYGATSEAGGTAAGATGYLYDGSSNYYNRGSVTVRPYGSAQNTGTTGSVPTPTGSIYTHGNVVITGNWNSMNQQNNSKDGNIELDTANVNVVKFSPSYGFTNTGNAYPNHYTSRINTTSVSNCSIGDVIFSQTSTCKYFILGTVGTVGYISNIGTVNIEGDITSTGGFPCAAPASTGISAGTNTTVIEPGSLWLSPPISQPDTDPATCTIGYPSSTANLRGNNLTTINHLYSNAGVGPEWQVAMQGNLAVGTMYIYGGKVYTHPSIAPQNTLAIDSFVGNGEAVLDLSQAPTHKGISTTVRCQSNGVRVIPTVGTQITLSSDSLEQEAELP
jgi:hypothetical protein